MNLRGLCVLLFFKNVVLSHLGVAVGHEGRHRNPEVSKQIDLLNMMKCGLLINVLQLMAGQPPQN